jgi:hypothetical protein
VRRYITTGDTIEGITIHPPGRVMMLDDADARRLAHVIVEAPEPEPAPVEVVPAPRGRRAKAAPEPGAV